MRAILPAPARALPIAGFLLLSFTASDVGAQSPGQLLWMFQGIEDVECATEIPDVDLDGIPEIVVETYDAGAVGNHLWCLSGGAPGPAASAIWSVKPPGGPSSSGGDGDECLRTSPDLNGDGRADILLGTAWGGRTAYAIDGPTGAVIWDFDTYAERPPDPPTSGWVYTIGPVGDTTGDGVSDVVFGCGSDNDRAYHASGAGGGILWSMDLGDAIFASTPLGDVSGDGIPDMAVGVGDFADAVWVMRGGASATPALWNRPMPGSVLALARLPDLDLDGKDEVIAGAWASDSTVFALRGGDGGLLWVADLPGSPYVMRLAVLDDVTGDMVPEIAVGTWEDSAFVLDGADGTIVSSFPTGGDVWAVSRVEDTNGDGIAELAIGSFDRFVYLVDVVAEAVIWRYDTGNRVLFVTGASDLNLNGRPDVFAGSQKLTGSPGGQGFLLEGGQTVTPAPVPMLEARAGLAGLEVTLRAAWDADEAVLERAAGATGGAAAAARFELEVLEAWRDGRLSTMDAVQARTQDPVVVFRPVSGPRAVVRGTAVFVDDTAEAGASYAYRAALRRGGVFVGYTPVLTVTAGGAPDEDAVPRLRVSPNPARGGPVRISFRIVRPQPVEVSVHDAAGRRVAALGTLDAAGEVSLEWDGLGAEGRPLAEGVYFVRVDGRDFRTAAKVTRLE